MSDWLAARTQARRDIHAGFAVAAKVVQGLVETDVTVRWHSKVERVGNIGGGDYSEILSTIDRLLFNSEELTAAGITLKHGDLVKLTDFGNYELELDVREPPDGPIKVTWTVVRP